MPRLYDFAAENASQKGLKMDIPEPKRRGDKYHISDGSVSVLGSTPDEARARFVAAKSAPVRVVAAAPPPVRVIERVVERPVETIREVVVERPVEVVREVEVVRDNPEHLAEIERLLAEIAAREQAAQGSEPAESAIPAALLAYVEDDMTVDEARAHLMQRWITLNAKRLDAQRPVEQRQFEFSDAERTELTALDAAFAWFQPQ